MVSEKTKEKEKYPYIYDRVAKKIFTSGTEASQEYLIRIVSLATGISYEKLKKGFHLIHPNANLKAHLVDSELDIAFESDEYMISFEINKEKARTTNVKNDSYVIILYMRQLNSSKDYDHLKPIYQINLDDYDYFGDNYFLYMSRMMETRSCKPHEYPVYIININLDYLKKLGYNDIRHASELEKLLYLFACSDRKQLKKIYKGDSLMGKIWKQADDILKDIDSMLYYDGEEYNRQVEKELREKARQDGLQEGRQEGLQEGIQQGIEQGIQQGMLDNQKEVAKKMLEKGYDISDISEMTELSIEDIEVLKDETQE